jgi:hypothetical protein
VGVRGLTDKVKDGARVRVDGVNGTIEILDWLLWQILISLDTQTVGKTQTYY